MNANDFKDPIIVGVLFILLTREWFDELLYGSFPTLRNSSFMVLIIKVILIMVLYFILSKIINFK